MAVVDGRASLLEECRLSPPAFLPPDQASQQRLPDLLETLRTITALAEP